MQAPDGEWTRTGLRCPARLQLRPDQMQKFPAPSTAAGSRMRPPERTGRDLAGSPGSRLPGWHTAPSRDTRTQRQTGRLPDGPRDRPRRGRPQCRPSSLQGPSRPQIGQVQVSCFSIGPSAYSQLYTSFDVNQAPASPHFGVKTPDPRSPGSMLQPARALGTRPKTPDTSKLATTRCCPSCPELQLPIPAVRRGAVVSRGRNGNTMLDRSVKPRHDKMVELVENRSRWLASTAPVGQCRPSFRVIPVTHGS